MKSILLFILKKAGSEFLITVLNELLDVLQGREDNTIDKDADVIKKILRTNGIKK